MKGAMRSAQQDSDITSNALVFSPHFHSVFSEAVSRKFTEKVDWRKYIFQKEAMLAPVRTLQNFGDLKSVEEKCPTANELVFELVAVDQRQTFNLFLFFCYDKTI